MTNDADNTDKGVLLGIDAIKRVAMSASVILITAMSTWTDLYFGVIQGLCIAFIVFVIATQMDTKHVQPRLIKRVCILYCNQEVAMKLQPSSTCGKTNSWQLKEKG